MVPETKRRGVSHGDMIDLNRENIPDFDVREWYSQLVQKLKQMDFEVTAMKTTYDANILTYCQWRDDLTMQQSPFCHVDNLIFCCLSYLNWDGIAEGFTAAESISLRDAARLWEHRPTAEQKVRVETDRDLLRQTAASRRFGEVRLFRYAEQFSETRQQQFFRHCISAGQ